MKEIMFRAKSTENYETNTEGVEKGDWVYGYYYFCIRRMTGIIVTTLGAESGGVGSGIVQVEIEVDHKTVGQYTGLKDKNGKEIYEGDILHITTNDMVNMNYKVMVQWHEHGFWKEFMNYPMAEVIGNIYEHPHLLNN